MTNDPFRPRTKDEHSSSERVQVDEDYAIVFVYDRVNSVFVKVLYRDKTIGEARLDDKKHTDASKFARDEIKDHRKAMRMLA